MALRSEVVRLSQSVEEYSLTMNSVSKFYTLT